MAGARRKAGTTSGGPCQDRTFKNLQTPNMVTAKIWSMIRSQRMATQTRMTSTLEGLIHYGCPVHHHPESEIPLEDYLVNPDIDQNYIAPQCLIEMSRRRDLIRKPMTMASRCSNPF